MVKEVKNYQYKAPKGMLPFLWGPHRKTSSGSFCAIQSPFHFVEQAYIQCRHSALHP